MAVLPEIRPARHNEADRLAATLTLALAADPSTRWGMPDANQYVSVLMPLVGAFGGRAALDHRTAHVIGDFLGAALWLPPGVHPDEDGMGEIFARHIEQPHLSAVYALFEAMAEHHPKEPHWYLTLIGVDPAYQRRGLGSALLQHALAVCDQDGMLAYLESTGPLSVPLYQRHGFEVMGEIVVGNSPPMFPMLRRPR
jgi:ribosomal protein S18 acetylase RimI-like enzyme